MSERELQNSLNSWIGNRTDASALFVRRLSESLGSSQQRKLWAFVDIRREFESTLENTDDLAVDTPAFRRRDRAQGWIPVLYVLPILFTWIELGLAVFSYRRAVDKNPGETIDFLAMWAGAQQGHIGLGFQWVAALIVLAVGLIIFTHWLNARASSEVSATGAARHKEVLDLLLDSQLLLVKSRAITPEEMADSLTSAAGVLQEALAEVAGVLPRFETISTRLDGVVNGLAAAAQNLDSTSQKIGVAAEAMNDLPTRAAPLVEALAGAPGAMQEVLRAFVRTSDEATRTNRAIIEAGSQLAAESKAVASVTEAIGVKLSELASAVESMTTLITGLPNDLVEPARVAKDLARDLEFATPVAILFRDSSEQMKESVEALAKIVGELKYAAKQYADVNDEHRGRA